MKHDLCMSAYHIETKNKIQKHKRDLQRPPTDPNRICAEVKRCSKTDSQSAIMPAVVQV
jgi:hypothetical protein